MAWRVLRGPSSPNALHTVQLDGRRYRLRWRWLQLLGRWALDVSTAAGVVLAGGLAVEPNFDLFREVRGARPEFPPGDLVIIDARALPQTPTLESLGGPNAQILYREASS